ncbi:hypothetical protein HR45_02045 [Shewanella mangrovi]|uniref:Uncharacterized protein n=1 Tax=Shewanella mangrovi TaxID=1515746 RepID=A0A094K3B0_9GAMM|nr:hypothetical protein [Shewanella mangrovi]KFZ39196.1 hypothetical protein HR45_02045 [Shewanella mangrovi]
MVSVLESLDKGDESRAKSILCNSINTRLVIMEAAAVQLSEAQRMELDSLKMSVFGGEKKQQQLANQVASLCPRVVAQ